MKAATMGSHADRPRARDLCSGCGFAAGNVPACASVWMRASSVSISCWSSGSSRSPCQLVRSAASTRRNSSGIVVGSINAGTSAPRSAAADASARTHRDFADYADHRTTTERAPVSASSITSSKVRPGGMSRSHQTDHPFVSSTDASSAARERSPFA